MFYELAGDILNCVKVILLQFLPHYGLVMPYDDIDLDQYQPR